MGHGDFANGARLERSPSAHRPDRGGSAGWPRPPLELVIHILQHSAASPDAKPPAEQIRVEF